MLLKHLEFLNYIKYHSQDQMYKMESVELVENIEVLDNEQGRLDHIIPGQMYQIVYQIKKVTVFKSL